MKAHSDHSDLILKAISIVEAHLNDEGFGVSELARELGMSRSNLHRFIKSFTEKSASHFIREIRLKKAFELLKDPSYTVSEVAFEVGFGSATYFSKCFHEYYGHPPGEVGENMDDDRASMDPFLKTGPKLRGKKRLKTYILISLFMLVAFVVILVVILKPFSFQSEQRENSIAVMPFRNDSPDQEKMYFINGTMEAILNNLCKIEDLRVISRNSVEQYRDHPKPTRVVARELNVHYILEGSGLRDGNNVRLFVQLIDGKKDRHIWSEYYDAEIEDIFLMHSEIAQLIASKIRAVVTPEEKKLIEKIPTTNLTAYDFYLRGEEELWNYRLDNQNIIALEKAEGFYNNALECDSTYAKAYCGLAQVYWWKNYWETLFTESFGDSVLILVNKALEYDDQLADAYWIRGIYYHQTDQPDRAIKELDIATKLNPSEARAYLEKAFTFIDLEEYDNSLENLYKAASLFRGQWLIYTLKYLGWEYARSGFNEKSKYYHEQALRLNGDSVGYYISLGHADYHSGNPDTALTDWNKAYAIDSNNIYILGSLAQFYMRDRQYKESLKYYRKYMERVNVLEQFEGREVFDNLGIAYVLLQNGFKEEADKYFEKVIDFEESVIEFKRSRFLADAYYRLATIYAIRGEKDKSIENLKAFTHEFSISSHILKMKTDPWWDILRDEPEFQQIIKEWEDRYHARNEQVRQWLEENDML